jgi:predicted DNA-binding mobile mystery protein A
MSVKDLVAKQYRTIVDRATASIGRLSARPKPGWLVTTRKALGMSTTQLGRRIGVTRARISQAELAESSGGVTLKYMSAIAEAMGCRFVYAIVPAKGRIEDLIAAQAHKKARALVAQASTHMALEQQSLSPEKNKKEVERVARDLVRTMPPDFWTD